MKLPVCDICRSLDVVCEPCGRKLAQKVISPDDFRVARALTSLEESDAAASSAEFSRALRIGPSLVIISEKPETIPEGLSSRLRQKVSVVKPRSGADSLAKVVSPLRFSLTEAHLPDGTTRKKALFPRSELLSRSIDWQNLKALAETLGLEATAA